MSENNPWTPTTAPVADAVTAAPAMRKPFAIWLLQFVCLLAVVLFLSSSYSTWSAWSSSTRGGIARVAFMASLVMQLVFIILLVVAVFAAQRRSNFGRWLGAALMTCVAAIVTYGMITSPPQGLAVLAIFTILLVLSALLIWFATFTKVARAWYARS